MILDVFYIILRFRDTPRFLRLWLRKQYVAHLVTVMVEQHYGNIRIIRNYNSNTVVINGRKQSFTNDFAVRVTSTIVYLYTSHVQVV